MRSDALVPDVDPGPHLDGVGVLAGACLSACPQGNSVGPSISAPTAQKGARPLGTPERLRWPAEGTAGKAPGHQAAAPLSPSLGSSVSGLLPSGLLLGS